MELKTGDLVADGQNYCDHEELNLTMMMCHKMIQDKIQNAKLEIKNTIRKYNVVFQGLLGVMKQHTMNGPGRLITLNCLNQKHKIDRNQSRPNIIQPDR